MMDSRDIFQFIRNIKITSKGIDSVSFSLHANDRLKERFNQLADKNKGLQIIKKRIIKKINGGDYLFLSPQEFSHFSIFIKIEKSYATLSIKIIEDGSALIKTIY